MNWQRLWLAPSGKGFNAKLLLKFSIKDKRFPQ
jgi:hypothetical protein